jgi:hypothetical protein
VLRKKRKKSVESKGKCYSVEYLANGSEIVVAFIVILEV